MMMKKLVLLFCLGLIPLAALAQEEPQTYIIKKGDTLWGISERFIKDPDYWPSLWSHNRAHYQSSLHLSRPAGEDLQWPDRDHPWAGAWRPAPAMAKAAAPTPVEESEKMEPVQEAITIKTPAAVEGFIGSEEFSDTGVLVDTMDNRIMMGAGDKVFVEMRDLTATHPGDRFSLYQLGKEVLHPVTGEKLGI